MRHAPRYAVIFLCLALGAGLSVAMGQDVSWDLRNYHLYNPISLIDHRIGQDFFPADKQAGLNPLPDFLYAWLALGPLAHFPRVLAAIMGLWYGLLIIVTGRLAARLFAPFSETERRVLIPLGTITAVTGAMTVSQIGTTSNDIAVAMLVLAGLLFVLRAGDNDKWSWRPLVAAGLLSGLAAGAKLTAAVFAPGLTLALLIVLPWRAGLRANLLFGLGWLTSFLAAFGWWGWMLWQRFGNPFYPMLNAIFKSPLAPPRDLRDMRYFPHDIGHWLIYPFFWAFNSQNHPVYETAFRDPRMAVAYIALAVLGWIAARHFLEHRPLNGLTQAQKIAALFLVFGYVAWLVTTSILRYAITLETLAIPVALVIIMHLTERWRSAAVFAPLASAICACLLCLAVTLHPDWGHRPFKDKVFDVDMSWVAPDTMFLGVYEPVAYLAAFVPPHTQFVGLGFISFLHGWPLGEQGENLVRAHQGPFIVLFREERRQFLQLLPSVGLSPDVKNCRTIAADLAPADSPPVLACEAVRL